MIKIDELLEMKVKGEHNDISDSLCLSEFNGMHGHSIINNVDTQYKNITKNLKDRTIRLETVIFMSWLNNPMDDSICYDINDDIYQLVEDNLGEQNL